MFHQALDGALLRFKQRGPSIRPLPQLPKRMPTRTPEAQGVPLTKWTNFYFLGDSPQTPSVAAIGPRQQVV